MIHPVRFGYRTEIKDWAIKSNALNTAGVYPQSAPARNGMWFKSSAYE